jgi:hypothetical protein
MNIRFMHFVWLACFATTPAWSQSSIYFDRGAFITASQIVPGDHQGIDFRYIPGFEIGPVLTVSNVTFTGRYLIRDGSQIPSQYFLFNFDSDVPLSIHFANGARAFGADFSSFTNFTATLSLDNGEVLSFPAAGAPDSTFFGFISPTPIIDLTFSDGGLFGFGNMHEELIGNIITVTVPEASTLVLFGLGGFFFYAHLLHRRVRRHV